MTMPNQMPLTILSAGRLRKKCQLNWSHSMVRLGKFMYTPINFSEYHANQNSNFIGMLQKRKYSNWTRGATVDGHWWYATQRCKRQKRKNVDRLVGDYCATLSQRITPTGSVVPPKRATTSRIDSFVHSIIVVTSVGRICVSVARTRWQLRIQDKIARKPTNCD